MADSNSVNILIVEDNFILAKDIAVRLSKNYNIVGSVPSAEEAIEILGSNDNIDIAIIDIILKGSRDGIELARVINTSYGIPFIFLTSHTEHYFIERAKSVKPSAYMLKPFNDLEVMIAIELALINFENQTPAAHPERLSPYPIESNQVIEINDSLFLKKNHYFQRVSLSDIIFLEADNNYTTIHTKSGKYIYSTVLKKMEEKLPKNLFMRVHRSYIINTQSVNGFEGNTLHIGGKHLPVSKQYRNVVFNLFHPL